MVIEIDSNMQEIEFHKEQENKFHLEDSKKPIDQIVYQMEDIINQIVFPNSLAPIKEEKVAEVWDTVDSFDSLFLEEVPREKNNQADSLPVSVPTYHLSDEIIRDNGKLEESSRPSIPDHFDQWLDFNDDNLILKFIKSLQDLS
jgi:hypothetical protein